MYNYTTAKDLIGEILAFFAAQGRADLLTTIADAAKAGNGLTVFMEILQREAKDVTLLDLPVEGQIAFCDDAEIARILVAELADRTGEERLKEDPDAFIEECKELYSDLRRTQEKTAKAIADSISYRLTQDAEKLDEAMQSFFNGDPEISEALTSIATASLATIANSIDFAALSKSIDRIFDWILANGSEEAKEIVRQRKKSRRKSANPDAETAADLVTIKQVLPIERVFVPVDKLSRTLLFSDMPGLEVNKKGKGAIDTRKQGTKIPSLINVALTPAVWDFTETQDEDDPEKTHFFAKTDAFTTLCLYVGDAFARAGNDLMSANDVLRVLLGEKAKPSSDQAEKVIEAFDNLARRIIISSKSESEVTGYDEINYRGSILGNDIVDARIGRKIVKNAIFFSKPATERIPRGSPLLNFAMNRNQVATVPASVFHMPLSLSEINCKLFLYMLTRILYKGNYHHTITYKDMSAKCELSPKEESRALRGEKGRKAKIPILLQHFKDCGLIEDYELLPDKIRFEPKKILLTRNGEN